MTNTTHTIPVSRPFVGRVEWAGNENFLYGIDSEGTVKRLQPYARSARKPGRTSSPLERIARFFR